MEYASAKTHAVIPEPQEKTLFSLFIFIISSNFFEISDTFLNVLFSLINSLNGRQIEFGIEPLLTFFLGSGTFPSNLSFPLASITKNSFFFILVLTKGNCVYNLWLNV